MLSRFKIAALGLAVLALSNAANAAIVGFSSVTNPSYLTSNVAPNSDRGNLGNIGYNGGADGKFYSLGLTKVGNVVTHGSIVAEFNPEIDQGIGLIIEVTNGASTYPDEAVTIEFSDSAVGGWVAAPLVIANTSNSGSTAYAFSVPSTGAPWKYVRFTDATVYPSSGSGYDGFDIDAIRFTEAAAVVPVPMAAQAGMALMGAWTLYRRFKR